MWKAPNRPSNDISQTFNDGFVIIYTTSDAAEPGDMPSVELSKKIRLDYAEQQLGIMRYYEAKQNQINIERVIRVPKHGDITTQDVAITENGSTYAINMVQVPKDVYPPCYDLTLAKYLQKYEVI